MTDAELAYFRLNARCTLQEILLEQIMRALVFNEPDPQEALDSWADELREACQGMALKSADPATSDMLAAEFEGVVESFIARLK